MSNLNSNLYFLFMYPAISIHVDNVMGKLCIFTPCVIYDTWDVVYASP